LRAKRHQPNNGKSFSVLRIAVVMAPVKKLAGRAAEGHGAPLAAFAAGWCNWRAPIAQGPALLPTRRSAWCGWSMAGCAECDVAEKSALKAGRQAPTKNLRDYRFTG
jgi:hypothetical protein